MPSKKPSTCPICHRPGFINLSQHLNGVHRIIGLEKKQLIQMGIAGSEVMVMEPLSQMGKHISFLEMLQRGEQLRTELMNKATQGE